MFKSKSSTFTALKIQHRTMKSNGIGYFSWGSSEVSDGVATICLADQYAG